MQYQFWSFFSRDHQRSSREPFRGPVTSKRHADPLKHHDPVFQTESKNRGLVKWICELWLDLNLENPRSGNINEQTSHRKPSYITGNLPQEAPLAGFGYSIDHFFTLVSEVTYTSSAIKFQSCANFQDHESLICPSATQPTMGVRALKCVFTNIFCEILDV